MQIFKTVPDTDALRRQPPPYVPPPQPLRKGGQSPSLSHLSPNKPSLNENFSSRHSTHSLQSYCSNPTSPDHSSSYTNSPSDQKPRAGMMLYNPIWNSKYMMLLGILKLQIYIFLGGILVQSNNYYKNLLMFIIDSKRIPIS